VEDKGGIIGLDGSDFISAYCLLAEGSGVGENSVIVGFHVKARHLHHIADEHGEYQEEETESQARSQ